eukprot:CAMPEP_0198673718 /NCGR_PEP_ID=MMETSP1467-20131203/97548_1 /TAXON_ID=1462469 /ORGANISM="unid. sp., Strain CCMP2135" /LENGTH=254 /DNA_ID=CAMNT_0044410603 /DNA_START=406 /DNA_END=1168 /DNA_ORIENTATION=+
MWGVSCARTDTAEWVGGERKRQDTKRGRNVHERTIARERRSGSTVEVREGRVGYSSYAELDADSIRHGAFTTLVTEWRPLPTWASPHAGYRLAAVKRRVASARLARLASIKRPWVGAVAFIEGSAAPRLRHSLGDAGPAGPGERSLESDRGHQTLDVTVRKQLLESSRAFVQLARQHDRPLVHVGHVSRLGGVSSSRFGGGVAGSSCSRRHDDNNNHTHSRCAVDGDARIHHPPSSSSACFAWRFFVAFDRLRL